MEGVIRRLGGVKEEELEEYHMVGRTVKAAALRGRATGRLRQNMCIFFQRALSVGMLHDEVSNGI